MSLQRYIDLRGWIFILSVVLYLLFALVPSYPLHLMLSLSFHLDFSPSFYRGIPNFKGIDGGIPSARFRPRIPGAPFFP